METAQIVEPIEPLLQGLIPVVALGGRLVTVFEVLKSKRSREEPAEGRLLISTTVLIFVRRLGFVALPSCHVCHTEERTSAAVETFGRRQCSNG